MQVIKIIQFTIILLSALINVIEAKLFICNEDKTKVIEFNEDSPYCDVHTEQHKLNSIFNDFDVTFVDDNILDTVEVPCKEREKYGFIFPGTLWCGEGTKANNFEELGKHKEEDKCCREHDHCPNYILAGECKGGICNNSSYTTSHCDCDFKFQECLQSTGTSAGNTIGMIFFNIARMDCYKEDDCDKNKITNTPGGKSESLTDGTCPFTFDSIPKYEALQTRSKGGRKLNLFEKVMRKVKLL